MREDKVGLACHVQCRYPNGPLQPLVVNDALRAVHAEGWKGSYEDGAPKLCRRRLIRVFLRVLGQKTVCERGALREAENGVEGPFLLNDVVQELVGVAQRVIIGVIHRSWPFVVAVIGAFVDTFNAGSRA